VSGGTGLGKTLIGLAPHYLTKKTVVFCQPLKALMEEHQLKLPANKRSVIIMRNMTKQEKATFESGGYDYVYAAAEAMIPSFRASCEVLARIGKLGAFVFDEAHCIPLWGHTFRDAYLGAGCIKQSPILSKIPMVLLSGTVTSTVLQDACSVLNIPPGLRVLRGDLNHPNHYMIFAPYTSIIVDLKSLVEEAIRTNQPLPIFVGSKKQAMQVYRALQRIFPALYQAGRIGVCHAGLSADQRTRLGVELSTGILLVCVTTSAMEMGLDLQSCVRMANVGQIDSPESAFQRMGRAGRAGQQTIINFFYLAFRIIRQKKHEKEPPLLSLTLQLQGRRLVSTTLCRRKWAMLYLEDPAAVSGNELLFDNDMCCDNCSRPLSDAKVDFGFELAWALETVRRHRGSNGVATLDIHMLVAMLSGSKRKAVLAKAPFAYLSEIIGQVKGRTQAWWYEFLLGPCMDHEFLEVRAGQGQVLSVTPAGEQFLTQHPVRPGAGKDLFTGAFATYQNRGMAPPAAKVVDKVKAARKAALDALLPVRDAKARDPGVLATTGGLWSPFDYLDDVDIVDSIQRVMVMLESAGVDVNNVADRLSDSPYFIGGQHRAEAVQWAELVIATCDAKRLRRCEREYKRSVNNPRNEVLQCERDATGKRGEIWLCGKCRGTEQARENRASARAAIYASAQSGKLAQKSNSKQGDANRQVQAAMAKFKAANHEVKEAAPKPASQARR